MGYHSMLTVYRGACKWWSHFMCFRLWGGDSGCPSIFLWGIRVQPLREKSHSINNKCTNSLKVTWFTSAITLIKASTSVLTELWTARFTVPKVILEWIVGGQVNGGDDCKGTDQEQEQGNGSELRASPYRRKAKWGHEEIKLRRKTGHGGLEERDLICET